MHHLNLLFHLEISDGKSRSRRALREKKIRLVSRKKSRLLYPDCCAEGLRLKKQERSVGLENVIWDFIRILRAPLKELIDSI